MVLSEGLSNTLLSESLSTINSGLTETGLREEADPLLGYSDGRRDFGSVSRAIAQVMAEANGELKVIEVTRRVEELLGGRVSRFTVGDHLIKHSEGETSLYLRIRKGFYRLR